MPQASSELQDWATKKFGSLDDGPIIKWLEEQGYKCTRTFFWIFKPGVTDLKGMTDDELLAVHFLIQEWDFGGVMTGEVQCL